METLLKNYKAIIFDMDGVLVNSLGFWKLTEEKMLTTFLTLTNQNLSQVTETESMSTKEAIAFWLNKYPQKNISIETIEQYVIQEMIQLIESNDCINKDVQNLILTLHQNSYLLGLATNSPKAIMQAVLNKSGLTTMFNTIITADDVQQVKPNPEIYLKTAMELNTHPNECLVIEDSTYGMQAAKAAGMQVVLYNNGVFVKQ